MKIHFFAYSPILFSDLHNFVNDENFVANFLYLPLTLQLERKEREMKILVGDLMFLVWNGGRATTSLSNQPRPNLFLKTDFLCTLLDIEAFLVLFVAGLSVNPSFWIFASQYPRPVSFFSSSPVIIGNLISCSQFYSSYSILTLLFHIPVPLGWRRIFLEERGKTETNLFCLVKACDIP